MEESVVNVLLTCLGNTSEAEQVERLAHVSDEIWRGVETLSRKHCVTPLLYYRLNRLNITLPREVAAELERSYLFSSADSLKLFYQLEILLQRLSEQEISVIVLKGVHLAAGIYDSIGLRPMSDIDLMVRKDDLMRVEQELLALHGEPLDHNRIIGEDNQHFCYMLPNGSLPVEVHWSLIGLRFPFRIDVPGLWARAQPFRYGNASALGLSYEDLILHLCLHTARHVRDMRLRMLCDISEIVQRYGDDLDWEAVGSRARQWGIGRSVYVVLRLARELLNVTVPENLLVALRPEDFDESYLTLFRRQALGDGSSNTLLSSPDVAKLWGPQGLGSKLAVIRSRLCLPRKTMALMYPAPADSLRIWLYYPVRTMDVLKRQGATLWQMMRRDVQTGSTAALENEVSTLRDWLMSN